MYVLSVMKYWVLGIGRVIPVTDSTTTVVVTQ